MLLKIQTAIYDVLMFYKVFSLHIFAKFSSNNNYFHQPGVGQLWYLMLEPSHFCQAYKHSQQNKAEISQL